MAFKKDFNHLPIVAVRIFPYTPPNAMDCIESLVSSYLEEVEFQRTLLKDDSEDGVQG